MPRTVEEILQHADELATRFESYEPDAADELDPGPMVRIRAAVVARSESERDLLEAIRAARAAGFSWSAIGSLVGTSGETARQRYARKVS